ncbi:MAG: FecR domain-containing protein [Candidatus Thiodiazotropha sp. (ex Codakia rugifera)]|nr:FecR domain-containing protein [Candidatus Thiodiazotropha sp. (ex Codakia rugifera)]
MTNKFTCILLLLFSVVVSPAVWSEDWAYRLHEGENLTLVAERFLKSDFTPEQLQVYNGIANDREIPVGTEIRVPIDWLKEVLAGVKVNYVFGTATLQRRGEDEHTRLLADTMLNAGDRVITSAGSVVSLKFADDTLLLIGERSEVVFDALSSFHGMGMLDTRIRLQRGRVENRVMPLKKPESRYEIHTPAAVTVVRGTDFRVSSDSASAQTRSEVTEGRVDITADGETVEVGEGEGTLVEQGKPPATPRKLLPKPDLMEMSVQSTADSLLLEWPVLSGATSYRYQVLNSLERMVSSGTVQENRAGISRLPAGSYKLQLRGVDEIGLEGFSASRDFTLEPIAPPAEKLQTLLPVPTLFQPEFNSYGIAVSWTSVANAWGYRLFLARDAELQDVLFWRLADDHYFLISPLPPGHYFVGVEALFTDTDERSRSNVYQIVVPGRR